MRKINFIIKGKALKALQKAPDHIIEKVYASMTKIANDDYQGLDIKKVKGTFHHYRLRTGDWRTIYTNIDGIIVIEFAHRKDIYKRR